MSHLPTGTVTFLFTDVEGHTKLWGQYPEAMKEALARHDALLRNAIEAREGYVFTTAGDAFCAAFATAPEALEAALDAQLALAGESWGETGPLRVRMGLHTGRAEERDGDYFGSSVIRTGRLMSIGSGGQVLVSLATEELIRDHLPEGVHLQDLGDHRLKDLTRPEHVFQLVAADLDDDFPTLKSLDAFPNNLPIQLTNFIGRTTEIAEVKGLLDTARFITFTGPGGTGKTRLSLQVAADVLDAFADGVWWVELAPLTMPDLVPQAVMTVLGLQEQPGSAALATLTDYLRDKDLLLILDNCEHLVEACAQLADALLRACPTLRLLASSREALGMAGEQTFPVAPLSLPEREHLPPIETLTQYETVQLFIDRAVAVQPRFKVTNENAASLASVCHHLDGIPLAIELAAVRVKVLSVEQIDARLNTRFKLLTGGSRTAAPRQQTLRAAIDWSYDLLSEAEGVVLGRLSVFAGGWTLEAAETVCADDRIEAYEVLDLLTGLVDKSLVQVIEPEAQGEEMRYRFLETIRQYARDKLKEADEEKHLRDRHLRFFLALGEKVEGAMEGADAREQRRRLKMDLDNLRSGLEWGLEEQGDPQEGARLAGALWRRWIQWEYVSEGRGWMEKAMEGSDGAPAKVRAKIIGGAGRLAFVQGDFIAGTPRMEKSREMYRDLDDKKGVADVTRSLGWAALNQHSLGSAIAHFEESLAQYREVEDQPNVNRVLGDLAEAAMMGGDLAYGRSLAEELLSTSREMEDQRGIIRALGLLGEMALQQSDYAAASRYFEEVVQIRREVDDKEGIARGLGELAKVAVQQGACIKAHNLLAESLAFFREQGSHKAEIVKLLFEMGDLALAQGDYARARELLSEGGEIDRQTDRTWNRVWTKLAIGEVSFAEGDLDTARTLYEESQAIARKMGNKWALAWGYRGLGWLAATQGDYEVARKLHGACLTLLRELEHKDAIAGQLGELGTVVLEHGEYAGAQALYEESLVLRREVGNREGIAGLYGKLGAVALRQGDDAKARELCEESLSMCRETGGKWALADALGNLGMVVQQQGDYVRAIDLYQESLTLRTGMGDNRTVEYPRAVENERRTGIADKRGIVECQEKLDQINREE